MNASEEKVLAQLKEHLIVYQCKNGQTKKGIHAQISKFITEADGKLIH